jgi:predicted PurR-regulated permease PerM
MSPSAQNTKYDLAALVMAGFALYAVLDLGLLAAFLAAVLVHELVHVTAPFVQLGRLTHKTSKAIVLAILATVSILLLSSGIASLTMLFTDRSDNVVDLLRKMADVVETARSHFPAWAQDYLPANAQEWESAASRWLRDHAGELQRVGENFGRIIAYILIGAIIGGLAALGEAFPQLGSLPPLTAAMSERAKLLGNSFRRVVFAQVRISALNTALTSIYLLVALPAFGINLPFAKTVIAITFLAGLLPVIGNLISNTVIVIVSLSISPYTAISSLAFLVIIHKLEYFINARIIGTQIRSRAWELLVAMLVMDAWFGVPGVIAAPIYYAYIKDELSARGLI